MEEPMEKKLIEALEHGDIQTAKKLLIEVFGIDIESARIQVYLGILNEYEHHYAQAMRHYRAALALDGTNASALQNLYRLGDDQEGPIRVR